MQIILVHPRLKQAKALHITRGWVVGVGALVLFLMAGGTSVLSYFAMKLAVQVRLPVVQQWVAQLDEHDQRRKDRFMRENLDALAVRIGRLQAQLTHLDAVGERLGTMAGVRREDVARAGRGGAVASDSRTPSIAQLDLAIDSLSAGLDRRADHFTLLEFELIERAVRAKLLPGSTPLADGAPGSRFGWRVDPFTGRGTMHEGMDFTAPTGTPILAAGAGVVVFAGYHPAYGNQVDVEHGNGLVTRYAHASRLAVKEGDIVRQGQWIADVGSTGRSTGPHLHFEVRVHDEARDPYKFLQDGLSLRPELAAAKPAAAPPRVPRR